MCAALILAAAGTAYHNSLSGPFIFDDKYWIGDNPTIRRLWPLTGPLFSARAISYGARPTVALTLAIDYAMSRTDVWAYHATNVALHALTALALFGVIRRTLRLPSLNSRFGASATVIALCSTLIWIVHPLQTAAVTYVIQRAEILVSLFYLLILYGLVRGSTAADERRKTSLLWYAGAVASAFLGAATKEVIVTAPMVALLYDRAFLSSSWRAVVGKRWLFYLTLAASWGVVAWVLIATRFHANSAGFVVNGFTWWSYLLTQPGVIFHYLKMTVWPTELALDYGWPAAQGVGDVWLAGSLVLALLAATVWAILEHPQLGFLPAAFFLILAPTSSFVPILDACFDHRMYLALAPLVVGFVLIGFSIVARWRVRRVTSGWTSSFALAWSPAAAVAILCVALAAVTIARNEDFRTEEGIWRDTVQKRPLNARAHNGLGDALKDQGQQEAAIAEYERALEIKPDFVEAYQSLRELLKGQADRQRGIAFMRRLSLAWPNRPAPLYYLAGFLSADGLFDEALSASHRAVAVAPANTEARARLADLLVSHGRIDEGIQQYEAILKIDPDSAEAHSDFSHALALQGRLDEAVDQAKRALQIRPYFAAACMNLADALARQGKLGEATGAYERAISIEPESARFHHDFGLFLAQHLRGQEALVQLREAVNIKADLPEAHNNLAAVLNMLGRRDEAIAECQFALNLNPSFPEAENNIGEFLQQQGHLDQAEQHLRKALELRPDYPEARKNLDDLLKQRSAGSKSSK